MNVYMQDMDKKEQEIGGKGLFLLIYFVYLPYNRLKL